MSGVTQYKAVGLDRLSALATFLEKLPRERFDYTNWVGRDWKGKRDLSCGTSACALGWATTMPRFRKLGLRIEGDPGSLQPLWVGLKGLTPNKAFDHMNNSLEAAQRVFRLDYRQAWGIFMPAGAVELLSEKGAHRAFLYAPGTHATPQQVAKHIRKFIHHARRGRIEGYTR